MTTESEVELDWKASTGKHRAACEVLEIPTDSPADVLLDKLIEVASNLYRHAKGTIDNIPLSDKQIDVLISSLMKRASKTKT